jgi:hypothetical protein
MLRSRLSSLATIALLIAVIGCDDGPVTPPPPVDPAVPSGSNVVLRWNEATLQAIRDTRPGPPQTARAIAVVHTAIYDAWAAYDPVATGTRLGDDLRRPTAEHTLGRQSMAVSYAAYRALVDLYPSRSGDFEALMRTLGYDPADASTDRSTPAGVGNVAAAALLAYRHTDGCNQNGELGGGPYSDYTGYAPANPPIDPLVPTPLAAIPFPERWQPLTFVNQAGQTVTPGFVCPHWGHVIPFAMTSPTQFRPVPPAAVGSAEYRAQCDELIQLSADLDDTTKVIAEYWADGPSSELPPGHFCLFAHWVSERDQHSLGEDVKMFFALTNAVFDAGIAVWEAKATYDYVRPVSAIRYLYNGQTIQAWAGPQLGTQPIQGEAWRPYQPTWFPTPPFAEYTSGHSAFSAAAATVLRLYTGSDDFGYSYTFPQGSSKVEPGFAPSQDITLVLPSFTAAADQAGISRRYGGIHFRQGDLRSRDMGRRCGVQAFEKARAYWSGLAVVTGGAHR